MRIDLQMLLRGMADRLLKTAELKGAAESGRYSDLAASLLVIAVFFLKLADSKHVPPLSQAVREQGVAYIQQVLLGGNVE